MQSNLMMVIGDIRPTDWRQGPKKSHFHSSFKPWRQLSQNSDLVS